MIGMITAKIEKPELSVKKMNVKKKSKKNESAKKTKKTRNATLKKRRSRS